MMLIEREKNRFVNKGIIYSDFVLNLNHKVDRLRITCIPYIEKEYINDCITTIFNTNFGILFHTIQYSNANKKLYFYTDKEISIKKWNEKSLYKPLSNSKEILCELKSVLQSNENNNEEYISLYNIISCVREKNNEVYRLKEMYKNKIINILSNYYKDSRVVFQVFNNDNKELKILFLHNKTLCHNPNFWKEIVVSKNNNDLYLKSSNTTYGKNIFNLTYDFLLCLFNLNIRYFNNTTEYNIKTNNSKFFVNINSNEVSIKYSDNPIDEFKIGNSIYLEKYNYECNSSSILELINGNEEEIFKKIYVRIKDCPEWIYDDLVKFRKKELSLYSIKKQFQVSNLKGKILTLIKK